ncbi:MAG: trypsin-like peptidase domain-containing protein [Brachybacterium sp.]|nr:trypsin-like peptidase domain-containing protein [Brachybacterium sp.]
MSDGQQHQVPGPGVSPAGPSGPPVAERRRGPGWVATIALVLTGALISSALSIGAILGYDQWTGSGTAPAPTPPSTTSTEGRPAAVTSDAVDWEHVAGVISPSTVAIQVRTPGGEGQGTGVISESDGTIVTNNHVVADASEIAVTLSDGRGFTAETVGTDPSTDLAVIRLQDPPADLQAATFGDSAAVVVGEPVMAVGTPLGLENTVTTGIISAVNRPVTASERGSGDASDAAVTSALQTDAPINPGNSGGPLVDATGQVVGINSSIAGFPSGSGQQAGSIGLGFAIPANTVQLIADQLIEHGEARHPLLGVTITDGQAQADGATYQGAEVQEVSADSPASAADIRVGDVITQVDGVPTAGATGLTAFIRSLEIGSEHTLTVIRDGSSQQITVTLTASR